MKVMLCTTESFNYPSPKRIVFFCLGRVGPAKLPGLKSIFDYKIYFWRMTTGTEVDFVIYGPRGLHAFEIKRSSQVTSKALKGLKSFGDDYWEARLHLLYLGKHKEY